MTATPYARCCYPDADRPSPPPRSPLECSGPRQAARRWASAPHAPAPSAPHAPATVGLRRCQGCHRGQSFNVLWLGPTFQCTLARDPGVRRYYVRRRVQKWRPFWLPDVRLSVTDTATQWHVVPHKASRDAQSDTHTQCYYIRLRPLASQAPSASRTRAASSSVMNPVWTRWPRAHLWWTHLPAHGPTLGLTMRCPGRILAPHTWQSDGRRAVGAFAM